jgi:chitinase
MRNKTFLLLILAGCFFMSTPLYSQFKVIGYLPTWNGYPNSINNVDLSKITHLNIAFANPNSSGDLIPSGGTLVQLGTVITTAHDANVKVLMSIGGAGAPGAIYTNLINNNLAGFVTKIVQFAVTNNLDGIDVDIEGDVLNGTTMTSTQYENFINALEPALHAENKLMTAALGTWFSSRVTNTAASKFDFINLMSYDAYGTWTGPGQHSSYDFAVNDLLHWTTVKNIPASKLTVGVPFYGYYWGTSNSSSTYASITNN